MQRRILTHYGLFSFERSFWYLEAEDREQYLKDFLEDISSASEQAWFCQVYPADTKFDILVWSNLDAEELEAPDKFMKSYAVITNCYRQHINPVRFFWGMTKPSIYSKARRSPQEIDPFEKERLPYFIVYPFAKTADWYLKSREERQEMMNDHIRLGKSYPEITQLLLYSFGLQDQEFIVAYETKDLAQFSDLVYQLRMTQARLYTLNDTPIIAGVFRSADELVEIFKAQ